MYGFDYDRKQREERFRSKQGLKRQDGHKPEAVDSTKKITVSFEEL
jgi:hypothetical protein